MGEVKGDKPESGRVKGRARATPTDSAAIGFVQVLDGLLAQHGTVENVEQGKRAWILLNVAGLGNWVPHCPPLLPSGFYVAEEYFSILFHVPC